MSIDRAEIRTVRGGLEIPTERPPRLREIRADVGGRYVGAGATGVLFSATGPVAVIMGAASAGSLTATQTASWIFGVFVLNGLLTAVVSWVYRMPLAFFWTIPGTVLVGQALPSLTWPEVVGAYILTGLLIGVLGATGLVARIMSVLPHRVVMAMVAGAFLSFGTDLIRSVSSDVAVAGSMVVAWVLIMRSARLAPRVPAVLVALLVGLVALALTGGFVELGDAEAALPLVGLPEPTAPQFNWDASAQLVIPLAITVIAVQNGQGAAVLAGAGHRPPVTVVTLLCGVWSVLVAPLGAVSTCLAGPTNALLVAVGERRRQYISGIACGVIAMGVGVGAPILVRGLDSVPDSFISALAGLAMLEALRGAFVAAFSDSSGGTAARNSPLGPLVTLLVTISGVHAVGLGAPFWGLTAGVVVTWVMDRPRSMHSP
ncbi:MULTISPECIES: benzoate/H(+) symporter BenE family transporter [Nocardiaceae]|jgi:benzoate membrane transport protein|uniref:benzoate/H(+) symporter BenE family transporter n=1 Tax=Nocardiaceae TaxID=85025 RepID=UPI00068CD302|nr:MULTISPECIES: benzoate/H(+) symporter BenE family transporter [Rhodococcus]OZE95495.1 benzoate transporter [Rhodococcus sp. 15-1189-1-1a]OZF10126.1 benzoate transporter [Rhodococcus sp. 14-2686-1-2]OZF55536.1 benzoate transporter [Rhodococcus sp. 14-2470-1b]